MQMNRVDSVRAVDYLKLKHIVITSVNRDDLSDGGASVFAACIAEARKHRPGCTVEVLIPDLEGNWDALAVIVQARPEVLNHNTETVPRLYRRVRPYANYQQTLTLLQIGKQLDRTDTHKIWTHGGIRRNCDGTLRDNGRHPQY